MLIPHSHTCFAIFSHALLRTTHICLVLWSILQHIFMRNKHAVAQTYTQTHDPVSSTLQPSFFFEMFLVESVRLVQNEFASNVSTLIEIRIFVERPHSQQLFHNDCRSGVVYFYCTSLVDVHFRFFLYV